MADFYGEVLIRRGWWVRRCATKDEAAAWAERQAQIDPLAVEFRVRPAGPKPEPCYADEV